MYLKSYADLRMVQSKFRKNSKGGAPGYVDNLNIKASLRNLNITSTGLRSCSSCHSIGHHGFGKSDVFNKDMKVHGHVVVIRVGIYNNKLYMLFCYCVVFVCAVLSVLDI